MTIIYHVIKYCSLYASAFRQSQRIWHWAKTEILKIQRDRFSSKWATSMIKQMKRTQKCDQVIREGQYIMSYIWHQLCSSSSQWQFDINKFINTYTSLTHKNTMDDMSLILFSLSKVFFIAAFHSASQVWA